MRKVKLAFTLIGRTDEYSRHIDRDSIGTTTNNDVVDYIRKTVVEYFGDRAINLLQQKTTRDETVTIPKYYAAGWLVSDGENPSELVVINYGTTFEDASKKMLDAVRNTDWDKLSVRI